MNSLMCCAGELIGRELGVGMARQQRLELGHEILGLTSFVEFCNADVLANQQVCEDSEIREDEDTDRAEPFLPGREIWPLDDVDQRDQPHHDERCCDEEGQE